MPMALPVYTFRNYQMCNHFLFCFITVYLIFLDKLTKDVEEKEKDESEDKNKDEVVFIQDIGFTIKIQSPGIEGFDIQVRR